MPTNSNYARFQYHFPMAQGPRHSSTTHVFKEPSRFPPSTLPYPLNTSLTYLPKILCSIIEPFVVGNTLRILGRRLAPDPLPQFRATSDLDVHDIRGQYVAVVWMIDVDGVSPCGGALAAPHITTTNIVPSINNQKSETRISDSSRWQCRADIWSRH